MPNAFCGLDFGTTNSCVAIADGSRVRVLKADPANSPSTSLPSLVYVSRDGEQIVGRAAAETYVERNIDREVEMRRVFLDTAIEAYVGAEPDKSESYRPRDEPSDVREGVRARATVEVNSPGRLFQSLKSSLRYKEFKGTDVFGRQYQIEELVSLILRALKEVAEAAVGEPLVTAVIGRPIRFSADPDEDALAERRLRTAARLAGFENVVLFYEPVAACVEYAVGQPFQAAHAQAGKPAPLGSEPNPRLMVVDIGGGTCDVCVMEFGRGTRGAAQRLAESRVLGVAGVSVAGDALDREIIGAKLFPRFGSRSRYGPSNLPMPQFIYAALADWQSLYRLNNEETIHWLVAAETSSTEPDAIRALRVVIQRNYGYLLAREVEAAKKALSSDWESWIRVHRGEMLLAERLERAEFSHIIEHQLHQMLETIQEAEAAAGLQPQDIDYVLATGGTCLIPAVRQMLKARYGPDRLIQRDSFTSVAAGLAIVAQYV